MIKVKVKKTRGISGSSMVKNGRPLAAHRGRTIGQGRGRLREQKTGQGGEERDVGETAGEMTSRDEWASTDRVKSLIWEIGICRHATHMCRSLSYVLYPTIRLDLNLIGGHVGVIDMSKSRALHSVRCEELKKAQEEIIPVVWDYEHISKLEGFPMLELRCDGHSAPIPAGLV
ncbi:hypothetical protein BC629DRAFT_1727161 [Irpex lacteus]|nr:hypothetical protein BC629DRAFT_1727161 [Irpex lacteus]